MNRKWRSGVEICSNKRKINIRSGRIKNQSSTHSHWHMAAFIKSVCENNINDTAVCHSTGDRAADWVKEKSFHSDFYVIIAYVANAFRTDDLIIKWFVMIRRWFSLWLKSRPAGAGVRFVEECASTFCSMLAGVNDEKRFTETLIFHFSL